MQEFSIENHFSLCGLVIIMEYIDKNTMATYIRMYMYIRIYCIAENIGEFSCLNFLEERKFWQMAYQ